VLAAHTLDDQAETVLLRLLRGSGAEGLGGMAPERARGAGGEISLRRPLLTWARRADTEGYCRARGVEFRADAMNRDEGFARVRVRRKLLPLLETFNPRAAEALARAASLLREDSTALDQLAAALLEEARAGAGTPEGEEAEATPADAFPLKVAALTRAVPALRRRALRLWLAGARGDLRRLSRAHLLGVERLLEGERGGRAAELPGGSRVERRRGLLRFRPAAETGGDHQT
jgi:tRNA(Ile)-lysidine synthase TilS/MesJ